MLRAATEIFRSWRWADKCAVELGAGLGLPSAALLALGAKRVVCTDGNKAMLGIVRLQLSRCTQPRRGLRMLVGRYLPFAMQYFVLAARQFAQCHSCVTGLALALAECTQPTDGPPEV
jgi:hypothetical protein